MAEEPEPEDTSIEPARTGGVRTRMAAAGIAARRRLAHLRGGPKTSATAEEPEAERAPVAEEVQRVRTELADAGVAARRLLQRVNWAWVTIGAAVQLVMLVIAWRLQVRRARRRRASIQYWVHEVVGETPRRQAWGRKRRR